LPGADALQTMIVASRMLREAASLSFHEKAVIVKQRLAALAAIKATSSAVLPSAL
jgi:hypothetical protein